MGKFEGKDAANRDESIALAMAALGRLHGSDEPFFIVIGMPGQQMNVSHSAHSEDVYRLFGMIECGTDLLKGRSLDGLAFKQRITQEPLTPPPEPPAQEPAPKAKRK